MLLSRLRHLKSLISSHFLAIREVGEYIPEVVPLYCVNRVQLDVFEISTVHWEGISRFIPIHFP